MLKGTTDEVMGYAPKRKWRKALYGGYRRTCLGRKKKLHGGASSEKLKKKKANLPIRSQKY